MFYTEYELKLSFRDVVIPEKNRPTWVYTEIGSVIFSWTPQRTPAGSPLYKIIQLNKEETLVLEKLADCY